MTQPLPTHTSHRPVRIDLSVGHPDPAPHKGCGEGYGAQLKWATSRSATNFRASCFWRALPGLLGQEPGVHCPLTMFCRVNAGACRPGDESWRTGIGNIFCARGGRARFSCVSDHGFCRCRWKIHARYFSGSRFTHLITRAPAISRPARVSVEQTATSGGRQISGEQTDLDEIVVIAKSNGLATQRTAARLLNAGPSRNRHHARLATGWISAWIDFSRGSGRAPSALSSRSRR